MEEHDQVSLPQSSSLIILLILFFAIGIVVVMSIVKGGDEIEGHETGGTQAFAPEDFPEIDWNSPLIEGLNMPFGDGDDTVFTVPPPPISEDYFPCSMCHEDMDVNPERRALEEMHDDIILDHGPKDRWCFDCHNRDDRDRLRLANGTLIEFKESYRLCGQCHGTIFRDWREGIHGRRRGFWNGAKSYLLCAHCHNPHQPKFKPIKPLPPPVRPEFLAG